MLFYPVTVALRRGSEAVVGVRKQREQSYGDRGRHDDKILPTKQKEEDRKTKGHDPDVYP